MTSRATWRRLSDWKLTVQLVDLMDVDEELAKAHGLVRPEERLRGRSPRLATLVATTRLARVDRALATKLHEAGIPTYEVGYHRVSDGLLFAEENRFGRQERDIDMAAVVASLLEQGADDASYDDISADAVDAVLRILSEGTVTERAVILAAVVPPLAAGSVHDESDDELEDHVDLDPGDLPDVSASFVDRVTAALAATTDSPRMAVGPDLSSAARHAYQKTAGGVGAMALAAGLGGLVWAPLVAVVAAPVVVLCLVIIVLHEAALRQDRRRGDRR